MENEVQDSYDLTQYDSKDAVVTKYTIWERKLLDFSLRNNLLNMRLGRKIIPLLTFASDKLEDALQAGGSFQVLPFPAPEDDKSPKPSDTGIYDSHEYSQWQEKTEKGLADKKLYSFQNESELKDSLKYVYRASRTSLEENGANNLYLVIGLLKWYESEKTTTPRLAPILLLPIEIVKGAGLNKYVIRARDEEIALNITLSELLSQQHDMDLSVLKDLPKDESGADVKKILDILRDKIKDKKRWEVLDETVIGMFSFNKFVMWNDIHSNSELMHQNPIISSLVEGKLNIPIPEDPVDARDIDLNSKPELFTIPIDVDSSQLEAVITSGAGRSFILHGPPGTGKSQTITNMIANALYQGKRVLFVAEKMAALEVVQRRLAKIGLSPFCLELHSNKATKQHFLKQMEEAMNVAHERSPEEFKRESEELFQKRQELIKYIEALHSKGENELSLFDCISGYLQIPGEKLEVKIEDFTNVPAYEIHQLREKIEQVDTIFRIVGKPSESPLRSLDITDGSPEAEATLRQELTASLSSLKDLLAASAKLEQQCGISVPDSRAGMNWATQFASLMLSLPYCSTQLIELCTDGRKLQQLTEAAKAGLRASEMADQLKQSYTPAILKTDLGDLADKWQKACAKWCLPRYFAQRAVLKSVRALRPDITLDDMALLAANAQEYVDDKDVVQQSEKELQQTFGDICYYGQEDWPAMVQCLDTMPKLRDLAQELAKLSGSETNSIISQLAANANNWNASKANLQALQKADEKLNQSLEKISKVATLDVPAQNWEEEWVPELQKCAQSTNQLKDWYQWCNTRRTLLAHNLSSAVNAITKEGYTGAQAANAFAKGLYYELAVKMVNNDDKLRFFNGLIFDDTISKYRQLTTDFQQLSKKELFCKLASKVPSLTMAAANTSEVGILKRNIKNGGRGTSIRNIIDQIPVLLPKLCPCMLMSPISVAQYLDLNTDKFDLVIFDEASQMPTSEAVGAIARGKALIVVGDPMQMPPTSFFATSQVGEDEAAIDDLESILDDCISLSIPSKYLTWHYRSKHESLIAFSNTQYYEGKLHTFPSVDDQLAKVTLRHVEGVYDKGRSRSNIHEAQAIVDEVIARLSDPELKKLSIGIVSFSKVQQDKIEDLLTEELAKYPELEEIAYNSAEPIFIKNLENVQGDERDVILFSVGYGPDAEGKVSMNFGPLNNSGGERRLNVAVSRARYEMVVFSSLGAEQIDLRRTNALGVQGLKKFLDFAESGRAPKVEGMIETPKNEIAELIAQALRERGHNVSVGVGRSEFKIDIAIADPDNPGKYKLGILCDGPGYYATKTVRDREVVQPGVLKGLKWNLLKVWTLDWWERPEEVLLRIENALNGKNEPKESAKEEKPAPVKTEDKKADTKAGIAEMPTPEITNSASEYVHAQLKVPYQIEKADQLEAAQRVVRGHLKSLIDIEQPITNTLLYKRIVKAWGLARVTPKVQALIDSLLQSMSLPNEANGAMGNRIFWKDASSKDAYDGYRVDNERDIQDVPLPEVANAMKRIVEEQIALDADDLKRLTAQQLGFTRRGNNVDTAAESAMALLMQKGIIERQDNRIKLK